MDIEDQIGTRFRLKEVQKKALSRLGISTLRDLLFHFPTRYEEQKDIKKISELQKGDDVEIYGFVQGLKTAKAYRKNIPLTKGSIEDETGQIKVTWFHQAYIAKTFAQNTLVRAQGKVSMNKGGELYLANPHIEKISSKEVPTDNLFAEKRTQALTTPLIPIYSESRGITSRWMYFTIQKILSVIDIKKISDPIPFSILKKYSLPSIQSALVWIHSPRKSNDHVSARKRFSFQEVFFIQLSRQHDRAQIKNEESYVIKKTKNELDEFIKRFPFDLTSGQKRSLSEILEDLASGSPMSRLLEGDVGSGKTAIAASVSYATIKTIPSSQKAGTLQVAYMVPTEILARQHFESFIEYFAHTGIQIGLITSSECRKFPSKIEPSGHTHISRTQLLKWTANGEIAILIGTHSLIQKSVEFENLALVIIDEQHRFGTKQRRGLARKSKNEQEGQGQNSTPMPHLLSMTATPIPRTLALTIYGDLDLSILDTMPKGRKPIITKLVPKAQRDEVYIQIEKELVNGHQAYVICPRIEEADPTKILALRVKSAKEEQKRLQEHIFPKRIVGLVHSKLKPKEKEEVMQRFIDGEIDILTSTSVIEVGVNVPNATIIIIEGAERFGLAQLHQLRGRVLRSSHQAFCYLFTDAKTDKSVKRLKALIDAKNGFELAELDLKLRGEGMLGGEKQWGISDVGMDAIKNIKMVEAARNEAKIIIQKDSSLKKYPDLQKILQKEEVFHFE